MPGGPQRMHECGWPDSKAMRNGMPGPSRCCWPMTSSRVLGRRRSARGSWWGTMNRSPSIAAAVGRAGRGACYCRITSAPAGGLNWKLRGRKRRIHLDLAELQYRALAEAVEDFERGERLALEADLHVLQLAVLVLGHGLDPLQAVALGPASRLKSACRARRSGAAANSAAGVEPSACACLRCVTWFRSSS